MEGEGAGRRVVTAIEVNILSLLILQVHFYCNHLFNTSSLNLALLQLLQRVAFNARACSGEGECFGDVMLYIIERRGITGKGKGKITRF